MKNTAISLRVSMDTKKKLKLKAQQLNLTLTAYLEKISNEPVVFLDSNTRALLEALKLKT